VFRMVTKASAISYGSPGRSERDRDAMVRTGHECEHQDGRDQRAGGTAY